MGATDKFSAHISQSLFTFYLYCKVLQQSDNADTPRIIQQFILISIKGAKLITNPNGRAGLISVKLIIAMTKLRDDYLDQIQ